MNPYLCINATDNTITITSTLLRHISDFYQKKLNCLSINNSKAANLRIFKSDQLIAPSRQ